MNCRFGAALGLIVLYPMSPARQEQFDLCCGGPASPVSLCDVIARLRGIEAECEKTNRCDRESVALVPDAPIARWVQFDEFETLAQCKAAQHRQVDTNGIASWAGMMKQS